MVSFGIQSLGKMKAQKKQRREDKVQDTKVKSNKKRTVWTAQNHIGKKLWFILIVKWIYERLELVLLCFYEKTRKE